MGSAFVRRSAVGIFIIVSRRRRHLAGSLASCQGGNGDGRVSRDGRGRAMYSPLLEKLDVLVLRHVCSHPLPLSVQSLGAGAPPATSNVNSPSPRRSDEDATTTRPKRARRRCSAVNLREAQDSAVPNGKHASDEPLTRSHLFTSAPVARSAAGEIRAVPGRRLETRVARRAGLDSNCPYEKRILGLILGLFLP